ncbi:MULTISPECIES: TIR domain-containing protein [unclassified Nitrosovibrio]|uniref:TIR domain-containing protein n=1 Tax=unclassified Nitrosovibrio TaxID=2624428 RepID=UPI0008CF1EDC|nr:MULTISPECIES: TIR domain-containing protein [unclassified Nitrosovibrio]SEO86988.1 TIR domain-containing protein [Nitrosovibrio sp. Nv6]SOD42650.1 TIR domain-containing protein [Nitrosovibrio sp. Nv4]
MASTNKVFISFALRDIKSHDRLLEQLNKEQTKFSFVDMPVKQSWEPAWKEECRAKVTECDGVIALVTANIIRASGQLWELICAYEGRVPVLLIHGNDEKLPSKLPDPVGQRDIEPWTWPTISNFLNRL